MNQDQQDQLEKYVEAFLNSLREAHKEINTIKNYRNDLEGFVRLSTHQKCDFTSYEMAKKYHQMLTLDDLTDNSIRRRMQTMRLFFDFLLKKSWCSSNHFIKFHSAPKKLHLPAPPATETLNHLWREICLAIKENSIHEKSSLEKNYLKYLISLRNQVIFHLIFHAGLKVSELASITRNMFIGREGQMRLLITRKNRDPVTVPLPVEFNLIFQAYNTALQNYFLYFNKEAFSEIIFNGNAYTILGGGMSSRGIENLFKDFSHLVKKEVTPKNLRQAGIFYWLFQKTSLHTIKEYLGLAKQYDFSLYLKAYEDSDYSRTEGLLLNLAIES